MGIELSRWAAKWRTSRRPNGRPSSAGRRAQRAWRPLARRQGASVAFPWNVL